MKNYNVYEDDGKSVYDELATNDEIKVGDSISYITRNQQGFMKYKVVLNDHGKKYLETIETYDDWINCESEDNYENQIN
jgi:hypothetical protein